MENNDGLLDGQPFNPYGLLLNASTPISLCSHPGLTQGAKLLYGRLALYAGRNGRCFPSLDSLATDMAVDLATVKRWLKELTDARLISRQRGGQGRPSECIFLWNGLLSASLKSASMRSTDSAGMRYAIKEEISKREISKESERAEGDQMAIHEISSALDAINCSHRWPTDSASLLEIGERAGRDASGMALFISDYGTRKRNRPRSAAFFLKFAAEDLPSWIQRNGERLARLKEPAIEPEKPSSFDEADFLKQAREAGVDDTEARQLLENQRRLHAEVHA